MILIGSSAIKHWFPDFTREPKDKDYVVESGFRNSRETEYLCNPVLFSHANGAAILEPNDLATLKASHLCWDINWGKHMYDLQFLLSKGCKINTELFFKLYHFWNEYHGKNKRSDLKMSKEDFFTNAINYNEHEHDELHKILNPVPVYTLVLKDGAEVELDPVKFDNLTHEQKLDFIREETMVMAWERYRNQDYRIAYSRMLKKFIMSHCPLFALQFTLENYVTILRIKNNYINQINDGINQYQSVK